MIIKKCCDIIKGSGCNITYRWLKNGKVHRENGPAIIKYGIFVYNGNDIYGYRKEWRKYGLLHNENGKSIEFSFAHQNTFYHLNGKPYNREEYYAEIIRRKALKENI